MTAPTHAAFGTLCYFFVAACLWWTVSPTVAVAAILGALLPDIDIPTSAVGRPLFPLASAINTPKSLSQHGAGPAGRETRGQNHPNFPMGSQQGGSSQSIAASQRACYNPEMKFIEGRQRNDSGRERNQMAGEWQWK